jgi:putative phage-type endonuclease
MSVIREEFLARRMKGIGGSDIAVLLGMSPFKTQFELWREKTGQSTDEPDVDSEERMHWGTVLEDVVARHYAEKTESKIQRINTQMQHKDCSIALANVDRAVVTPGTRARWDAEKRQLLGADRILEVKTAHAFALNSADWGEQGTDEVPQQYWLQCMWYMGIAQLPSADLAVLFGGQRYRTYRIEFDGEVFAGLLDTAATWWDSHVIQDIPPDPNNEADARARWARHVEKKERIVSVDIAEAVEALQGIKARIKELEQEEQFLRDQIVPAIEDAEAITYMGQRLATLKAPKDRVSTDWEKAYMDMSPAAEHIIPFQTTKPGPRVLRLATPKKDQ